MKNNNTFGWIYIYMLYNNKKDLLLYDYPFFILYIVYYDILS
jgi:hypothetical protein